MGKLETIRSRAEWLGYQAIKKQQDGVSVQDHLKVLLTSPHKGLKAIAAINMLGTIIPGAELMALSALLDINKLQPIGKNFRLIGCGSARYVFSFDNVNPDLPKRVLKVGRKDFGDDEYLKSKIAVMEADQFQTQQIYSEIEGFVPTEEPFLGPSITCDKKTIYAYQPQVEGPFQNVFKVPVDELALKIERNSRLNDQFQRFVDKTEHVFKTQRTSPDIIGRENLVMAERNEPELVLLDGTHLIRPFTKDPKKCQDLTARILEKIAFLQAVQYRIPKKILVNGTGKFESQNSKVLANVS